MIREKLGVHKQYLVISAPVPFRLIANNGTDSVMRSSGIWQLDCYKLLPEKYMANYPVFNLELEYDETKIPDGFTFEYYFTNLNLGDSLKGVSGDLVELSEYQFSLLTGFLDKSVDFPSYKSIGTFTIKTFSEYPVSHTSSVPIFSNKVLYLGCVFITKNGDRYPSKNVVPLYIQEDNSVFKGIFEFYTSITGISINSQVSQRLVVKTSSFTASKYSSGFYPTVTNEVFEKEVTFNLNCSMPLERSELSFIELSYLV